MISKPPPVARPIQKERFENRAARIKSHLNRSFKIDFILACEARLLVEAYYGGPFRMLWALFKHYVREHVDSFIISAFYWISDRMGWTVIVDVPQTDEYIAHQRRHGIKCHMSPNCEGGCIDRNQPKWFRKFINWYVGE